MTSGPHTDRPQTAQFQSGRSTHCPMSRFRHRPRQSSVHEAWRRVPGYLWATALKSGKPAAGKPCFLMSDSIRRASSPAQAYARIVRRSRANVRVFASRSSVPWASAVCSPDVRCGVIKRSPSDRMKSFVRRPSLRPRRSDMRELSSERRTQGARRSALGIIDSARTPTRH